MAVFTNSCVSSLCCVLAILGFAFAQTVPTISTSLDCFADYQPNVAYFGIPYASPPTGTLHFSPPQLYRPANHASVLDCYHFCPGCFQVNYASAFSTISTPQSENMLSLNIWAPPKTLERQGLPPVINFLKVVPSQRVPPLGLGMTARS